MRGGSGAVGSFFFLLPPTMVGGLVSGGVEGMVGVSMGIVIGIPSIWGEGMVEGPSLVDVNTKLELLTPY
jgi:hypothetical protein